MIQLNNIEKLTKEDIPKLVELVKPELDKRKKLYARYKRKNSDVEIIHENKSVTVPFEKYIVDIASGYLGGKEPSYEVEKKDEKEVGLIKKILNKILSKGSSVEEMQAVINYITRYNDDGAEHYQLVKDILSVGACYEILYENEDNEIVYSRLNPLQTIAIWDYSVPRNLIGLVSMHSEKDINNKLTYVIKLIDNEGTRVYRGSGSEYEEEDIGEDGKKKQPHNWKDVPADVVEIPDGTSLFEPVLDLIDAYQELVKDTKETFSYNNDAKLKITGYRPEEELLIKDEKTGQLVENKVRVEQDKAILNAKIFYTPDDGDIEWIEKTINDSAIQNTLKTYIDLIMMNTGVPQTTDLGFTKADNASAIDRKFFSLEQMTTQAMQLLTMAYKRRWELVFDRINLTSKSKYDFRDVNITLNKNLPANENEVVDMYMKLRGLISDETIISRLPLNLDATSEEEKMQQQDENELNKEVAKAEAFNKVDGNEKNNKENKDKFTK